jgi:hypothetical protein
MNGCGKVALIGLGAVFVLCSGMMMFVFEGIRATNEAKEAREAKMTPEEKAREEKSEKAERNGRYLKRKLTEFVQSKLKAPSTAKINLTHSVSSDLTKISVQGTIDSQNSFGAMIRSNIVALYDAETLDCLSVNWDQP